MLFLQAILTGAHLNGSCSVFLPMGELDPIDISIKTNESVKVLNLLLSSFKLREMQQKASKGELKSPLLVQVKEKHNVSI